MPRMKKSNRHTKAPDPKPLTRQEMIDMAVRHSWDEASAPQKFVLRHVAPQCMKALSSVTFGGFVEDVRANFRKLAAYHGMETTYRSILNKLINSVNIG